MMPALMGEPLSLNNFTAKFPGPIVELRVSDDEMNKTLRWLAWDWDPPSFEELGVTEEELQAIQREPDVRPVLSLEQEAYMELQEARNRLHFEPRCRSFPRIQQRRLDQ